MLISRMYSSASAHLFPIYTLYCSHTQKMLAVHDPNIRYVVRSCLHQLVITMDKIQHIAFACASYGHSPLHMSVDLSLILFIFISWPQSSTCTRGCVTSTDRCHCRIVDSETARTELLWCEKFVCILLWLPWHMDSGIYWREEFFMYM